MTTHKDGALTPEELAVLADTITGLRPGAPTTGPAYEAGYRHALHDAAGEVIALSRRVSAQAYAAELDAAPPADDDAGLGELADVAKSLLGLAVRLDAADQADIDKRLDALGGGARG